MSVTKSQERAFVEQFCQGCSSQRCEFPLEWREGCLKWIKFEQMTKGIRNMELTEYLRKDERKQVE